MHIAAIADLTDDVLDALTDRPQTAPKLARRLRADVGTVRRILTTLVGDHYAALTRNGGRDTYTAAR